MIRKNLKTLLIGIITIIALLIINYYNDISSMVFTIFIFSLIPIAIIWGIVERRNDKLKSRVKKL